MGVLFEVEFASRFTTAKQWVIDGWVKEGTLFKGDELVFVELDQEVKVKDIALAFSPMQKVGRITFSIEEPRFDFEKITRGMTLRNKSS